MAKKPKHSLTIASYRNKRSEEFPVLRAAVYFFLDKLLKRCTLDYQLEIKLYLKKPEHDEKAKMHDIGAAYEYLTKDRVWYKIEIANDLPFLELLSAIAHELVHVVQFATGRLQAEPVWKFEGTEYGEDPYKGTEADTKLPWEHEAYSKDNALAQKFVKQFYSNW